MPDLAIIVPTRGRPENIRRVIAAWDFTNAWADADLVLVVDADDPEIAGYRDEVRTLQRHVSPVELIEVPAWMPMVHKLDAAARDLAEGRRYFALGFAGDDHLPQTIGWAARYLTVLRELGTGMVHGDDGYQGSNLSSEWAITSDVVRALGRMVPAPVEHMYCDNSMMDLFTAAGAMRYLPEVRIEHMHPVVGKAETDEQYQRVNHRDQFRKDRTAYEAWQSAHLVAQAAIVRELRAGRPDEGTPRPLRTSTSRTRRNDGRTSGPSTRGRKTAMRTPRHFKNVRAATPEDVMMALADFAAQVPADQEIVELGVFQGRTALQMAWGASQGHGAHVTGIDPWSLPGNVYDPPFTEDESRRWAMHWVQSLGYSDKIHLVNHFSTEVAAHWMPGAFGPGGGRPVGLLYVDGDHTREGAKLDIVSWAPHLAPGARIAVDDYGHPDWPGVGEAVDELVAEGFLEPIQLFHDRLAVTRLTDVIQRTDPAPEMKPTGHVTAITSEGVTPSPYPAMADQVAVPDEVDEMFAAPVDTAPSTTEFVAEGELEEVPPGTKIYALNLVNLKALAKARGIVLGVRKDKRDLILQALRDGA